jgi:hypothetical protein
MKSIESQSTMGIDGMLCAANSGKTMAVLSGTGDVTGARGLYVRN